MLFLKKVMQMKEINCQAISFPLNIQMNYPLSLKLTSGRSAMRTSSYLIGEIFLHVLYQSWAEQMFKVKTNRPAAT